MRLGRAEADAEAPRNILVAEPGGDQARDFDLAPGERRRRRRWLLAGALAGADPAQQAADDTRRAGLLAAPDLPDQRHEIVDRSRIGHIARDAGLGPGEHV